MRIWKYKDIYPYIVYNMGYDIEKQEIYGSLKNQKYGFIQTNGFSSIEVNEMYDTQDIKLYNFSLFPPSNHSVHIKESNTFNKHPQLSQYNWSTGNSLRGATLYFTWFGIEVLQPTDFILIVFRQKGCYKNSPDNTHFEYSSWSVINRDWEIIDEENHINYLLFNYNNNKILNYFYGIYNISSNTWISDSLTFSTSQSRKNPWQIQKSVGFLNQNQKMELYKNQIFKLSTEHFDFPTNIVESQECLSDIMQTLSFNTILIAK